MLYASGLRWLYVDFNSYFASVEQQLNPALRGRPVAVLPVMTDTTCAIAASYEAKKYGVKTGVRIADAKRMCPGLICVPAQHERYVEYHHRIREEIWNHLPIAKVASIDEVACRLMDNESAPEKAAGIAHAIKAGLARAVGAHVRCSIGIAPNCYLAKVATDMQKPDGLVMLTPDVIEQRLLSLELRDLPGVGFNMERRLRLQGVGDMKTLLALPPRRLRTLWGSVWGERMWHFLRGRELEDEPTERRTVGHSHVLSPELRPVERARIVARRLTLKAAARLRRMDYRASLLCLSARIENGPRLEAAARCWRVQDSMTFLYLLDTLWARMTAEAGRGARIKKISVTLLDLAPNAQAQPELFDTLPETEIRRRDKAERLSRALDHINHKFGRDSMQVGMLPADGRGFSGTKIAFTRIPDKEEFRE